MLLRRLTSHFSADFYLCFKQGLVNNHSFENKLELQDSEHATKAHFHMKGCAPDNSEMAYYPWLSAENSIIRP